MLAKPQKPFGKAETQVCKFGSVSMLLGTIHWIRILIQDIRLNVNPCGFGSTTKQIYFKAILPICNRYCTKFISLPLSTIPATLCCIQSATAPPFIGYFVFATKQRWKKVAIACARFSPLKKVFLSALTSNGKLVPAAFSMTRK
jgi:hypothetical protein